MATTEWTGDANNGDFTDDDNWTGDAPGAGDTALFIAGEKSVTSNLAALAAVNLAALIRGPGYSGTIGLPGQYLQLGATNVYIEGTTGATYLQSGTSDDLDNVYVRGTSPQHTLYLRDSIGVLRASGGVTKHIQDSTGKTIGEIIVQAVNGGTPAVHVLPEATLTITTARVLGGSLILDAVGNSYITLATLIEVLGGSLTVNDLAAMSATLRIDGGTVNWNAEADPSNAADVDMRGGVLTFAGDKRAKTISNDIRLFNSGNVVLANGCRNILMDTGTIQVFGANNPVFDVGMKITAYSAV